ncbi:hypothetical protein NMY22_g1508 [Coprinellus aureogranulatus]|nr:hypothetical protein NMY22_g1508 [Coprinellus aureogranulatus]
MSLTTLILEQSLQFHRALSLLLLMSRDYYCIVSGIAHIPSASIIYETLDERNACIPPSEQMIKQAKRLIADEVGEEAASDFEIRGEYIPYELQEMELNLFRVLLSEPSEAVVAGLQLSEEDIDASEDLVLIAGYEPDADHPMGMVLYSAKTMVGRSSPRTRGDVDIRGVAVLNVVPRDDEQTGVYHKRDDLEEEYNLWTHEDSARLVTFSAYCILKTVAPEIEPSTLYRLFTDQGIERESLLGYPRSLEYGPIVDSWDQYANWTEVCDSDETDVWWVHLLCCSKSTDGEILEQAWNGRGNLWVYVRPDRSVLPVTQYIEGLVSERCDPNRFPIAKAVASPSLSRFPLSSSRAVRATTHRRPLLEQLPMELFLLVCQQLPIKALLNVLALNKQIRETLLPHIDEVAYSAMATLAPWYFPSKPIETPHGSRTREDLDWWEAEWSSEAGLAPADIRQSAPWMKYWIQCTQDSSMRNRKRIWRVAEGIRELASVMSSQ